MVLPLRSQRAAASFAALAAAFAVVLAAGCGEYVVYENVGVAWDASRTLIMELGEGSAGGAATGAGALGRAGLFDEQGLDSGVWLEVESAPGAAAVGGYFQPAPQEEARPGSSNDERAGSPHHTGRRERAGGPHDTGQRERAGSPNHAGQSEPAGSPYHTSGRAKSPYHTGQSKAARAGSPQSASGQSEADQPPGPYPSATLLVVLPGASTFYPRGMVEKARDYHLNYLTEYHDAGYATWTLALPECGAPYATEDLAATRVALDWLLNGGGREALGVDRVHLIGASAGGLIALRAALEYDVAAVVDVSGLTRPDQLIQRRYVYSVIASWFPLNTGLCQFADTFREYGPPDGPGWDNLDVVGRVAELRCPLLAIHSTDDIIYEFSNLEALQAAIAALPPDRRPRAEFFVRTGGHIDAFSDPPVTQRILQFLQARERANVGR